MLAGGRGGSPGQLPFLSSQQMEWAESPTFLSELLEKFVFLGVKSKKPPFELKICRTNIRFSGCQLGNGALK